MSLSANSSYICCRCLSRRLTRPRVLDGPAARISYLETRKSRFLATVRHSNEPHFRQEAIGSHSQGKGKQSDIRLRLQIWEEQNALPSPEKLGDETALGVVPDNKTPTSFMNEIDHAVVSEERPLFDGDQLVDIRSEAAIFQAGDLVEVSSDTWKAQILAICLGKFGGYDHFYTSTGKWFTGHGVQTLFTVSNFVNPLELTDVIDALPSKSASEELLNVLQDMRATLSRAVGGPLIRKMAEFQAESERIHQANAAQLDSSYDFLGGEGHLTLDQIAELLLPKRLKKDGKFPAPALYAVHSTLMQDDVCYRPVSHLGHVRSYLFEISSLTEVRAARDVEKLARDYLESRAPESAAAPVDGALETSLFGRFVLKARKVIDESRRSRRWSPHGMLGPASSPASPILAGWTELDLKIIHYMYMWAGQAKFSRSSRQHGMGSAVLRATQRYEDSLFLDQSTGWTFLQEIGWLLPWEIHARYNLRLPGVDLQRGGGTSTAFEGHRDANFEHDLFAGNRKDWAGMTAFCIDSARATDIDDAISLEPADRPGEYWIHVHVADPASSLHPSSALTARAALIPQTVYLPGYFERMIKDDEVRTKFSLAPDKPCLTFSAKVDNQGSVLDYKIAPGILRNVIYITGQDVSTICEDSPNPVSVAGPQEFSVGRAPTSPLPVNRKMTSLDELSKHAVRDLRTLSQLGRALQDKRLERGAIPLYWPRPSTQVSFENVSRIDTPDGSLYCSGDPYIRISYDSSSSCPVVDSTMRLAGEVAARWCSARGVPIPYRTQPRAAGNLPALRALTRDVLYPQLAAGRHPRDDQWRAMRALVGPDDVAVTPAPHFTMGVDMYAKATSPLRRYADLLAHWQVEAALLEEAHRGASLVGNTDDTFLPFTRAELEHDVLPLLRVRERLARALDNGDGNAEWILQALVRAWRFGDGEGLPGSFRFTVNGRVGKGTLRGRLNWFDQPAVMGLDGLGRLADGAAVRIGDVRTGDEFEVELADVNVYNRRIIVRALRRL